MSKPTFSPPDRSPPDRSPPAPPSPQAIANQVQRASTQPDQHIWLSANAGTGKTKVLSERVLRLLLSGARPEGILCVTYTKAAAAEMTIRIREILAVWAACNDQELVDHLSQLFEGSLTEVVIEKARNLFNVILDLPGGLRIQTIHAFAQSLLERFPLEAGLIPNFKVLETETERLKNQSIDFAFVHSSNDDTFTKYLELLMQYFPEDRLLELFRALAEQRLNHPVDEQMIAQFHRVLNIDHDFKTVGALSEYYCQDSHFDRVGLQQAYEVAHNSTSKTDVPKAEAVGQWLNGNPSERALLLAETEEYLSVYFTQNGTDRKDILTKKFLKNHDDIRIILEEERERLRSYRAQKDSLVALHISVALAHFTFIISKHYQAAKISLGLLDFSDLIFYAQRLLNRQDQIIPWVQYKLDQGLDHILLDEGQDTSQTQWQILTPLMQNIRDHDRKNLRSFFVVGDVKQSIYSFQGAAPHLFHDMRQSLSAPLADQDNFQSHTMQVSFRSSPAVLGVVDSVFAQEKAQAGVNFNSENNDAGWIKHIPFYDQFAGQVELWPLLTQQDGENNPDWDRLNHQTWEMLPQNRLAETITRWIKANCGRLMLERQGRPLKYSDILILLENRKKMSLPLIQAFKAAGLPVAGIDRLKLNDQLVIKDILALAEVSLNNLLDYKLAVILKSPFIGLDEDSLFALCHGRGPLSLWEYMLDFAEQTDDLQFKAQLNSAIEWLQKQQAMVNKITVTKWIAQAMDETCPALDSREILNGRKALIRRLGTQCEEPIEILINQSINMQQEGPVTLYQFIHDIYESEADIKREADNDQRDEIRIMTVHGAKGLEAPIVILPIPDHKGKGNNVDSSLFWHHEEGDDHAIPLWMGKDVEHNDCYKKLHDRRQSERSEERNRLLYVALTRAEERLIVCGWQKLTAKTPRRGDWYQLIAEGMLKLDGVKAYQDDHLLFQNDDFEVQANNDSPEDDPLDDSARFGLSYSPAIINREVMEADKTEPKSTTIDTQHEMKKTDALFPNWILQIPESEPRPTQPLMPSRILGDDDEIFVSPLGQDGQQFYIERGLIVHELLEILPEIKPSLQAEVGGHIINRKTTIPAEHKEPLLAEVLNIINHAEFGPIFGENSRAEVSITGSFTDNQGQVQFVSGRVDRLVITTDQVLIIDYKTQRPPPTSSDLIYPLYKRQMMHYAQILQKIYPNHRIKTLLLWTFNLNLMEL